MIKKLSALLLLLSLSAQGGLPPTNVKTSSDASNVTTISLQMPNFTGSHVGTVYTLGVNGIAGGGTGQATKGPAFDALAPTGTLGDTIIRGSSSNVSQAVPPDQGRLIPDSIATNGWRSADYTQVDNNPKSKNYIRYFNFENNSNTGWTLGTIGTLTNGLPTGTPTFGSGASGNLSIPVSSTGAIDGSYSLDYTSSAATTVGNMMATPNLFVYPTDRGQVLSVNFQYQASSGGTNVTYAGNSTSSFAWAAWDVTNAQFLSSQGNFCMVQGTGVGSCPGASFQTATTTANIRFIFYNSTATAGAVTLVLDDFVISPQVYNQGYAGTSLVSFTPTLTGFGTTTPSTNQCQSERIGDQLYESCTFVAGTVTGSTAAVSLGYNGGNANVSIVNPASTTVIGKWTRSGNQGSGTTQLNILATSSGAINFSNNGSAASGFTSQLANVMIGSGENVSLYFTVPISGWNSQTATSADSSSMVTNAIYSTLSSTTVTASTALEYTTQINDSTGAYSTGTGKFTAPSTGIYNFNMNGTYLPSGSADLEYSVNSASGVRFGALSASRCNASFSVKMNAGDNVVVYSSSTVTAGDTIAQFSVTKATGSNAVQAPPTEAFDYYGSAQTITTTPGPLIEPTKLTDKLATYSTSTGLDTAQNGGTFACSCSVGVNYSGLNTTTLQFWVGGSAISVPKNIPASTSNFTQISEDAIPVLSGQTIGCYANSSSTSSTGTGNSSFSCHRVGY